LQSAAKNALQIIGSRTKTQRQTFGTWELGPLASFAQRLNVTHNPRHGSLDSGGPDVFGDALSGTEVNSLGFVPAAFDMKASVASSTS
jgi:hypothetical protein